jgi:hypothetical protein
MKKGDLLSAEFFEHFKDSRELQAFIKELQNRGEQLLEGKLDAYCLWKCN